MRKEFEHTRSPSIMYLETSSRRIISSSSDKSFVILLSILRSLRISRALVRPIPWMYCSEYWTLLLFGISTPPTRAHLMLNPPTCKFTIHSLTNRKKTQFYRHSLLPLEDWKSRMIESLKRIWIWRKMRLCR